MDPAPPLVALLLAAAFAAVDVGAEPGLVPRPPIVILGDNGPQGLQLAPGVPNPAVGVVRGSGTAADPYVVEGWLITGHRDGSGFHAGIDVHGTTKPLLIRGNTVRCLPAGSSCDHGIALLNARNVRVEANVLDGAGDAGLFVGMPFGGPQRHNVTIADNRIERAAMQGLFLVRLNHSVVEGNRIANNPAGCECFSVGAFDGVGGTAFRRNDIAGNLQGLFHSGTGTVLAEENWWGHASGPASCTNPGGKGNGATCNVDHTPWATEPQAAAG